MDKHQIDKHQIEAFKSRMDAFSDAVIAIIITIMVLEIPLPAGNHWTDYLKFAGSISVFLVSFVIVAYWWYTHAQLFNQSSFLPNHIVLWEIIWLALLSLVPIFTKWTMVDLTNRPAIVSFSVLYFFVQIFFTVLTNQVIQGKYPVTDKQSPDYRLNMACMRWYGLESARQNVIFAAMIVGAYFFPTLILFAYLCIAIVRLINVKLGYFDKLDRMSREEKIAFFKLDKEV